MWLGCEWRHARKRWAGILGDFEKKQLIEMVDEASWYSGLGKSSCGLNQNLYVFLLRLNKIKQKCLEMSSFHNFRR